MLTGSAYGGDGFWLVWLEFTGEFIELMPRAEVAAKSCPSNANR
jgi:hypothetical protein